MLNLDVLQFSRDTEDSLPPFSSPLRQSLCSVRLGRQMSSGPVFLARVVLTAPKDRVLAETVAIHRSVHCITARATLLVGWMLLLCVCFLLVSLNGLYMKIGNCCTAWLATSCPMYSHALSFLSFLFHSFDHIIVLHFS